MALLVMPNKSHFVCTVGVVVCDMNGKPCSGSEKGDCLPGLQGCVCKGSYTGEYCQHSSPLAGSASRTISVTLLQLLLVIGATAAFIII